MLIIRHRVNTVKELEEVPKEDGVEVDVRDQGGKLILSHDPFVQGDALESYLKNYHHRFIIFNIKCEGIENRVIALADRFKIDGYFLLDVSAPFTYKLANQGVRRLAVRFSEWESPDTCLNLAGKVDWAFVDVPTKLPLDGIAKLKDKFKLCLVSPELWGRQEAVAYRKALEDKGIQPDAVLTKDPEAWK